jgi:Protein of unknown function (DUF3551)
MRRIALFLLAAFACAFALSAAPAGAQTYTPGFPVCLHVYGPISYYDCSYMTLPECNATASGRPAQCILNPYFASAGYNDPPPRHWRRHYAY